MHVAESSFKFYRKGNQKKVAVLGGSFAIKNAIQAGRCLFDRRFEIISFMKPTAIKILDILKERYTKNYIVEYLRKKSLILQLFYQKKIQIQLSTYRIWRIRKN
jgi:hypothetical protein